MQSMLNVASDFFARAFVYLLNELYGYEIHKKGDFLNKK